MNFISKYLEEKKCSFNIIIHEFILIFMETLFPPFSLGNFSISKNVLYPKIYEYNLKQTRLINVIFILFLTFILYLLNFI